MKSKNLKKRHSEAQSIGSKSSSNFLDSQGNSVQQKSRFNFSETSDHNSLKKKSKSHFAQTLPSSGSNSRSKKRNSSKSKKSMKSKRKKSKKNVKGDRLESLDSLRTKFISPIIKGEGINISEEDDKEEKIAKEKFESFSQVVAKKEKIMFESFIQEHKSDILNNSSKNRNHQIGNNELNQCILFLFEFILK